MLYYVIVIEIIYCLYLYLYQYNIIKNLNIIKMQNNLCMRISHQRLRVHTWVWLTLRNSL